MKTEIIKKKEILEQLRCHHDTMKNRHLASLFINQPNRFADFSIETDLLFLDYSKHHIVKETKNLLIQLAHSINLEEKIDQLFTGHNINFTEKKSALHTLLRQKSSQPFLHKGQDIMPLIQHTLQKMEQLSHAIHSGTWRGYTNKLFTDIVNIGIGGSDLGPLMVTNALKPYQSSNLHLHFVANVDATHISETLKNLNPETTLFIIASKSFYTEETLLNAGTAKQWLNEKLGASNAFKHHMLATSANQQAVIEFGITEDNFLPIWDWVGGRFSIWSAIGFPIVLAIGIDNFKKFLSGAESMDKHFKTASFDQNMPVLLALISIWYINFFGAKSHLILPYDHYLQYFCDYIQQLEMESNGKQVNQYNQIINYSTSPIVWGQPGCIGQHSFHQFLYQGTELNTADFICPMKSHNPIGNHHLMLFANCISQARALMFGKSPNEIQEELATTDYTAEEISQLSVHKSVTGNRPSNMLLFPQLTPETLGALIALYEHKVYVQGCIWEINSFDQYGVELGKEITKTIFAAMQQPAPINQFDSSTNGIIHYFRNLIKEEA